MAIPQSLCSLAGRIAALNMLAHGTEISTVPYLWTAMFGKSIRYAGKRLPGAAESLCWLEVSWDREARVTSLTVNPPHQPLPQGCFPAWLLREFSVSSETHLP